MDTIEAIPEPCTRHELKALVQAGQWTQIGNLFNFPVVWMTTLGGRTVIDWRCVPQRVYSLLQRPSLRPDGFVSSPRKRLPSYRKKRQRLFENQKGACHYCKRPTNFAAFTVDHVVPLSRGGANVFFNLVGACQSCNSMKANLTAEEFAQVICVTEREVKYDRELRETLMVTKGLKA